MFYLHSHGSVLVAKTHIDNFANMEYTPLSLK